jgi:hypothetical protein
VSRKESDQAWRDAGMFTPTEVHCEVGIARAKARARDLLPPGLLLDGVLAGLDEFAIVSAASTPAAPDLGRGERVGGDGKGRDDAGEGQGPC